MADDDTGVIPRSLRVLFEGLENRLESQEQKMPTTEFTSPPFPASNLTKGQDKASKFSLNIDNLLALSEDFEEIKEERNLSIDESYESLCASINEIFNEVWSDKDNNTAGLKNQSV